LPAELRVGEPLLDSVVPPGPARVQDHAVGRTPAPPRTCAAMFTPVHHRWSQHGKKEGAAFLVGKRWGGWISIAITGLG
jgi:hypothetical protein